MIRYPVAGQGRPFGRANVVLHLAAQGRRTHAALHRVEVNPIGASRTSDQFISQPASGTLSFDRFGTWQVPVSGFTEIIRDRVSIGSMIH